MPAVSSLIERSAQIGREIGAVVRQGRLMSRRGIESHALRADRAVLFVHGFMAAGAVFDPMRAHVEAAAEVETLQLSYGPLDRFDGIAERLGSLVRLASRGRPVTIVGHSLGGILARWYVQELGGAVDAGGPVDRLVTLASPHGGTRAARFAPGSLGEALRPGSRVLQQLRDGRHRAAQVAHVAVVAGRDRMITPPSSAGEILDADLHVFADLGHNEALFDPRVLDLVARFVR
jgi:triacylglycerol lipase